MPYAIELYFDQKAAEQVGNIHNKLKRNGIRIDEGTKPHVSLCIYQDIPEQAFTEELRLFARRTKPLGVSLSMVGTFQTERPVIFLSPTGTSGLFALHQAFHDNFAKYAEAVWDYYRPGIWVPHCTLCMDLSPDMYRRAMEMLEGVQLPIEATFEAVGILEFHPNKQLSVFELG